MASEPMQERTLSDPDLDPNMMNEGGEDLDGRPLPPGWTNEEHDGQRLYVDHKNRRFSYVHPSDLPRNGEGQGPITNSRPGTAHVPDSSLGDDRFSAPHPSTA